MKIEDVLNFFNFSAQQLKILLGISIASIGVVYTVGVQTTDLKRDIKEIKEDNKNFKEYVKSNDQERKKDFNIIYNDIINRDVRNNELWNSKFSLLIKYGNKDTKLLEDLIYTLDEKEKNLDENLKYERLNSINPSVIDSTTRYLNITKVGSGITTKVPMNKIPKKNP